MCCFFNVSFERLSKKGGYDKKIGMIRVRLQKIRMEVKTRALILKKMVS